MATTTRHPAPALPADRHARGLTRWFAGTGALLIALFSLGMAWLLSNFLESNLIRRDAELSRDFAQSVVDTQQVAGVFRSGKVSTDAAFIEFFAHLAAMPDVLRANIYTPDHVVLWSSRPEIIGLSFDDNPELDRALRGEVVAEIDDEATEDRKAEHVLLSSQRIEFVENYLPMYDGRSGQLVGVVELYRRPVKLWQTIRDGQLRLWLGALVGGVGLFLGLVWFVRRIERSLRDQQSRLVESEALAMVGELSAAVAHSIRNPLGSIRSSAELQRELGASAAIDVEDVIRQVDRIERLVRTLLTYARESADQLRRCDVRSALDETRQQFATEFAAQGKPFSCDWHGELGEVAMDPVLLQQVLASVLANAAEATAPGEAIRLAAAPAAGMLQVSVEDLGPGIASEQLAQVAQPYFTTKPRGLGLGLSLARRAVERSGGRLSIERLPGRGTRVCLWLPQLPPLPPATPSTS